VTPELVRVVERRIEHRARHQDPLDDLLHAAPTDVLAWMRRKARLADGTAIGLPVCDARNVSALVASKRAARPRWSIALSRKTVDAWSLIEIALLRDLAASSWKEAGGLVGRSDEGAAQCYGRHVRALELDAAYADVAARLAREAIDLCYGVRSQTP
jgi:hypothetical protein